LNNFAPFSFLVRPNLSLFPSQCTLDTLTHIIIISKHHFKVSSRTFQQHHFNHTKKRRAKKAVKMDELMELMEDASPPAGETGVDKDVDDGGGRDDGMMDELAMLMMDEDEETTGHPQTIRPFSTTERSTNKPIVTPSSRSGAPNNKKKNTCKPTSVDDRLGIRMLNRLVSSADLLELLTDHPYFSPATLSAMPLAQLNTLLHDPARIVDPATVAGKTNLVTVGMVFSNSGTRLSSKNGSAFCVLTIGSNLASGPCVTLFLFGEVYGKYCRTCTPGKVVAVLGPKLLPAKDSNHGGNNSNNNNKNSDSAISFSIYDRGQLQLVATARDYGTCQGKVRVKQRDGTWSNNGTCKAHVDTRVSEFCEQHRRQQNSTRNANASSKFQQLKQQQAQQRVPPVLVSSSMTTPRMGTIPGKTGSNRFLNPNMTSQVVVVVASKQQQQQIAPLTSSGQRPPNPTISRLGTTSVPMHMSKTALHPLPPRQVNQGLVALQDRSDAKKISKPIQNAHKKVAKQTVVGDLLKQAISSHKAPKAKHGAKPLSAYMEKPQNDAKTANSSSGNKRRKVNTDGVGFDGSVPVPKPSGMFAASTGVAQAKSSATSSRPSLAERQQQVLQQQAELARLRQEQPTNNNNKVMHKPHSSLHKENGKNKNPSKDDLFAALGDFDEEKVRNAKSRFANEIAAEEYAASRQKVIELEKLEERQIKKTNNKESKEKRLTKDWRCKTCQQNYSVKPKGCFKAGHDVITVRNLRKEKTKEEARTALHNKRSEDGGLQLGAGLEWSGRFEGTNFYR
jgi:minichromosome maintenance protein 10